MAVHTIKTIQKIPASKEAIWDFISSPKNLKEITPEYMGFEIKGDLPEKMYPGMMIQYKVSPLLGIKMTWVTEITHVQMGEFFVDEQRVGPYKMWHHQHHIKEIPGGVLMEDIIDYQAPLGFLGDIANILIIKKQLAEIFEYRRIALENRFGIFK
ncbi:MAG: ligand-binding SRPBCC domain-containing protein [Chitinophagales bacterium]|jgi:ligand-binding SRPBCC domain-containing protein